MNGLQKDVKNWAAQQAEGYEDGEIGVLNDLANGGCASGMVGHLIYHSQTEEYFKKHYVDICDVLAEYQENIGETLDLLSDGVYNKASWLAFEIVADKMLYKLESK